MKSAARLATALALAAMSYATLSQDQLPTGVPAPRPGEEWTKAQRGRDSPVTTLDKIDATVVGLSHSTAGRFIVTLDNGTRWTQIEDRQSARVAVGDSIKVHKSTIGSYMLTTRDGIETRVSRAR